MTWNDAPQFESRLRRALDAFNWTEAQGVVNEVCDRIRGTDEIYPERSGKILIQGLRRKRKFDLMTPLAESLLQSGLRTPQIRRQYAQALIDQGILAAAEAMLQMIVSDPQSGKSEELEARGLTGRIYKQLYVNNNDPRSPRNRENLERALSEYMYGYRLAPQANLWHGINVVALAERARRDGLPIAGLPDTTALSREILAVLKERELERTEPLPAWDIATEMEARVALGEHDKAVEAALRYIEARDADAFEVYSTLRQLVEVWQLDDRDLLGRRLLPILKAGHLDKQGAAAARDTRTIVAEAKEVASALKDLEGIYGPDRMVTLRWYKRGLDQCNAVARVERRNGIAKGTGWLVNAADFFSDRTGVLLLTNAHVVSDQPSPMAIFPDDAAINFQALSEVFEVEDEVVWTSPVNEFDATFLTLKGTPAMAPLTLHKRPAAMAEPAPRMYIIGYPDGRDLELSLQDNCLLACNDRLLHYRTPTEQGSSGSPVFEPEEWRVIALHHKGSQTLKRLDSEGTYEANEGIAILAIQKHLRGA